MRKNDKPIFKFILTGIFVPYILVFFCSGAFPLAAQAATVGEIQAEIDRRQRELEKIYEEIAEIEDEQDLIQEQIDDLNAEIVNTITSIGVKQDEISDKEKEISDKEGEISVKEEEIVQKQIQIEETEAEYEAAVEKEDTLRQNIAACTRIIYENGTSSYLNAFLEGKGLADILNQMDYIEKMYVYEKNLLQEYVDTKNQVLDLWDRLEAEKADLESDKEELEADREELKEDRKQLEADREELEEQKASLNTMLAKKKEESANYAAEIEKARQEAAVAKKLIQQDQQKIKQMQAAQSAANITYSPTSYTNIINNASGSDLGKKIANFACQYIGNPYKSGGTSLTGGADCSGFTYRVYSEFGYSIPRTSTQQRSAGTSVNYSDAQPGDLICYDGHVALYIGDGLIVHASNSKPYPSGGIKVSRATYRTILSVRRICQ